MDSIFTITHGDLNRFSPEEAVAQLSDLLWAEARRLGIPMSKVNISGWINMPDGGIDATVDETAGLSYSDLIKPGRVGYQIKADSSFSPWQKSKVQRELFKTKTLHKRNLNERVRALLDAGGAL